jgi:hypothetical protein
MGYKQASGRCHVRLANSKLRRLVGEDESLCVRGKSQQLNLRVRNLTAFLQIAKGVDDETWMFHLREGDYSRWFRDSIKDEELAAEAQSVEPSADADQSRSSGFRRSDATVCRRRHRLGRSLP